MWWVDRLVGGGWSVCVDGWEVGSGAAREKGLRQGSCSIGKVSALPGLVPQLRVQRSRPRSAEDAVAACELSVQAKIAGAVLWA